MVWIGAILFIDDGSDGALGKKMKNRVKKIEDLMKIYYGPNMDGENVSYKDIKSYEDDIRTRVISPFREKEVEDFFSPIGQVKKLSRGGSRTSDYIIGGENILIEVTSINTVVSGKQDEHANIPINLPRNENDFIERINRGITHTEIKEDRAKYKISVIFYDVVIMALKKELIEKLSELNFIKKTYFPSSSIDALLFLPPSALTT